MARYNHKETAAETASVVTSGWVQEQEEVLEQSEESEIEAEAEPTSAIPTVKTEIAGTVIFLPVRFVEGHVISAIEAKVLDTAIRRQYVNNINAAVKSFAEKVQAGKASASDNPYTEEKILADFLTYIPNVAGQKDEGEKLAELRYKAGLAVLTEIVAEHNALVASQGHGPLGNQPAVVPSGRGSKELRDSYVNTILSKPAYASRVEAHLEILKGTKTKVAPSAVTTFSL